MRSSLKVVSRQLDARRPCAQASGDSISSFQQRLFSNTNLSGRGTFHFHFAMCFRCGSGGRDRVPKTEKHPSGRARQAGSSLLLGVKASLP